MENLKYEVSCDDLRPDLFIVMSSFNIPDSHPRLW